MANRNLIPYIGFFGQMTKTAASISFISDASDVISKPYVKGHISHADGLAIPFYVPIDNSESFLVGDYRFYFKNWTRTK